MHLFAGSTHRELAESLAKELGVELGKVYLHRFSSGEQYVRYEQTIRGRSVYILQSTTSQPDRDLMELFLMCQAAKLSFAKSIHVVIPHFPYARQDRVAEPREPISAKLIAHLLEESGADHVITLNLHSSQIQGFFSIPVDALDVAPTIFAPYFRKKEIENPVVVSPDAGGVKRAKKFADEIGAEIAMMHKIRPEHQKAEILEVVGAVEGRTCIIFDDMIDTGGSLITAHKELLKRGANKEVYAVATHPVFSGDAEKKLKEVNFKEIVVTDSIPLQFNLPNLKILPTAKYLADVIRSIESGSSVTGISS